MPERATADRHLAVIEAIQIAILADLMRMLGAPDAADAVKAMAANQSDSVGRAGTGRPFTTR